MSDLKMSDAFVLPVSSNNGDLFNSKNPIGDTRICKFYNMNQFKASKAAAHAINSHDSLVEQNKVLREALALVVDKVPAYQNIQGGGYAITLSIDDVNIIKEALSISEL